MGNEASAGERARAGLSPLSPTDGSQPPTLGSGPISFEASTLGTGAISFETSTLSSGPTSVEGIFQKYDANGDGTISKDELRAALQEPDRVCACGSMLHSDSEYCRKCGQKWHQVDTKASATSTSVEASAAARRQIDTASAGRGLASQVSLATAKVATVPDDGITTVRALDQLAVSNSGGSRSDWDSRRAEHQSLDNKASDMAHNQWTILREQLATLFREQTVLKTKFTHRLEDMERKQQEGQSTLQHLQQARVELEPALEKRFGDALQLEIAGLREGARQLQVAVSKELEAERAQRQQLVLLVHEERGQREQSHGSLQSSLKEHREVMSKQEDMHGSLQSRLEMHQELISKQDDIHAEHRQDREEHASSMRDHVQNEMELLQEAMSRESKSHSQKHEEHEKRAEELHKTKARLDERLSESEQRLLAEFESLQEIVADERRAREEQGKKMAEEARRSRAEWAKEQHAPLQERLLLLEQSMHEVAEEHRADLKAHQESIKLDVRTMDEKHRTAVKEFKGERTQFEVLHENIRSHKFTGEELAQRVEVLEQRLREGGTERERSSNDLSGRFRAQKEQLEFQVSESAANTAQLHEALQADLLNERQLRESDSGKLQERYRELQVIVQSMQTKHEEKSIEHKDFVIEVAGRTEHGVANGLEMIEASVVALDEKLRTEAKGRELDVAGLWEALEGHTHDMTKSVPESPRTRVYLHPVGVPQPVMQPRVMIQEQACRVKPQVMIQEQACRVQPQVMMQEQVRAASVMVLPASPTGSVAMEPLAIGFGGSTSTPSLTQFVSIPPAAMQLTGSLRASPNSPKSPISSNSSFQITGSLKGALPGVSARPTSVPSTRVQSPRVQSPSRRGQSPRNQQKQPRR